CDNVFCTSCIQQWTNNNSSCPFRCPQFEEKRCPPMINALLSKLNIKCKFIGNGCTDVHLYDSIEKHEKNCQYQQLKCQGCSDLVLKKDLTKHELVCAEVKVECIKCKYIYKQHDKHELVECLSIRLDIAERNAQSSRGKIEKLEKMVENLETILHEHISICPPLNQILQNIPLSSLEKNWYIIYDHPYSWITTTEELRQLYIKCIDKRILVGAINGSSSTVLALAAIGPSSILQLETHVNGSMHYSDVYWYLASNKAFGFSPSPIVNPYNADTASTDGDKRLCWYLSRGVGGYRAGTAIDLLNDNNWRKVIMTEK
ncbi:unnamed protein product, partial [Didymodactylos carnosus]